MSARGVHCDYSPRAPKSQLRRCVCSRIQPACESLHVLLQEHVSDVASERELCCPGHGPCKAQSFAVPPCRPRCRRRQFGSEMLTLRCFSFVIITWRLAAVSLMLCGSSEGKIIMYKNTEATGLERRQGSLT